MYKGSSQSFVIIIVILQILQGVYWSAIRIYFLNLLGISQRQRFQGYLYSQYVIWHWIQV